MKPKHKILLITTTHLAKNPRLVKEIETFHSIYNLSVVFFQILPQYVSFDDEITNKYPSVKFYPINWLHKFYPYRFFFTLLQKLLIIYWKITGRYIFPEQQFFPGYFMLLRKCKPISFDIIHGHNPGSLGVVYHLARRRKTHCGFDAEDFHSGEYKQGDPRKDIIERIEGRYLPKINLLICASPLIGAEYKKKFKGLKISTINNSFPKNQFNIQSTRGKVDTLKLVWFSQNVGLDRGLADILEAINQIHDFTISFSIIGVCSQFVKKNLINYLKNERHQLVFCGLMSNEDLNLSLSRFDVGIASEPGKDFNNCIALSNKIFAYAQAGLAILASNTPAQRHFMETYKGIGQVYPIGDSTAIKNILNLWLTQTHLLLKCRETASWIGKMHINWEIESNILILLIKKQLEKRSNILNIAITVDPEIPVPPTLYGGIERIVYLLVEELCLRGHGVTLFAHRDSKTSAKLISWHGKSSPSLLSTIKNSLQLWQNFRKTPFDVVHSFSRLAYLSFILNKKVKKLMSYQREPTLSQIKKARFFGKKDSLIFTGCSNYIANQIRSIAPSITIHNAVNTSKYHFNEQIEEDAPLIFLGRIEEIKGPHLAIELAKLTHKKLIIAGNIPVAGQNYYKEKIAPLLDENIIYLGEVNDSQKNELLGSAAALIMPIQWNEPFGIVMIEAMACGTPVIGFKRGSLAEIVVHEENGFVCNNLSDMVEAVKKISTIERLEVRKYVEKYFSAAVITDQYLRAYHQHS